MPFTHMIAAARTEQTFEARNIRACIGMLTIEEIFAKWEQSEMGSTDEDFYLRAFLLAKTIKAEREAAR